MSTNIIALSGRKQSGKTTTANQILGLEMTSLGIVRGACTINPKGQLYIDDLFGDKRYEGVFDVMRNNESMNRFRAENLDPYVKIYSFADLLKQHVCIDILGLSWEQCYGTDEQKNTETHLRWEHMPGVMTPMDWSMRQGGVAQGYTQHPQEFNILLKEGFMTGRDVMQFAGTEIFRKMYHNVWVDSTIRRIRREAPAIAVICDTRFPNEVMGVKEAGGRVLRLTRAPFKEDEHASETALDEDKFDWSNFDAVVDNELLNVAETCQTVHPILEKWGLKYE